MNEYLQYMKALRSQMSDVEDQAEKTTVEEQMQITTIQSLVKELDSAKSETRRLKEDTDLMVKAKGHICSQILEKQRKIALLETDSSTLSQTLQLIQQERVNLSAKLVENRTYYSKAAEEINNKLQEQQEWLNSHKQCSKVGQNGLLNVEIDKKADEMKGITGKYDVENQLMTGNLDGVEKVIPNLNATKDKFDLLTQMRSELVSESSKVKQSIELVKHRMNDFKPELREMVRESLEEELQALLSDKSGETEYLQSLKNQIEMIKGISHVVNCGCGEKYRVEVDLCA